MPNKNSPVEILSENSCLTIRTCNRLRLYRLFVLGSVILSTYIMLITMMMNSGVEVRTLYFFISSFSFLVLFGLVVRKSISPPQFRIKSLPNGFLVNGASFHLESESKYLIVYEFAGETLINSVGSLSLQIGHREYELFISANENTITKIRVALKDFFQTDLVVKKKLLV